MARINVDGIIPANDEERVKALGRYKLLDAPAEESFNNIARLMADVFSVPIALISIVDKEEVFFKGNAGMPGVLSTDRSISLCSFAVLSEQPTVFDKPLEEPFLLSNPLVHGAFGLRFYAAAPLLTSDGHAIGSVCIIDKKERSFSKKEQEMLVRFSKTVMHQIEMRLDTIRKAEVERELTERNEDFKMIIQQAPVAMVVFKGEEMVVETVNEQMLELMGNPADSQGRPLLDFLPELKDQFIWEALQAVYKTGEPYYGKEWDVHLMHGGVLEKRQFNFSFTPILQNGKVTGVMDVATEVTEQVSARRRVEESEGRFRSIVEEATIAMALYTGEDIRIAYVNDIMLGYWGKDRSIVGKTLREALPELESQPFPDLLDQVFATGIAYRSADGEAYLVVDGKLKRGFFNFTYKPLLDSEGRVWGIHHMALDVTEQVTAQKKLLESETKLAAAIELAELATWSLDLRTGVFSCSERMAQWMGGSEGPFVLDQSAPAGKKERLPDAFRKAVDSSGNPIFDKTYTIIHAGNGQQRTVHTLGRISFNQSGEALSISGTAQDITAQKDIQTALESEVQNRTEELQAINEELAETNNLLLRSNEELTQYAYVASHDLQEPLRKIQVFTSILANSTEVPPRLMPAIRKIQHSAGRMIALIRDLLNFSQLLKSDSLLEPVDLNKIMLSVKQDFSMRIADKKASLVVSALPVVQAVPFQMQQLFHNLVGNALKFLRTDTEPVVEISYTEEILAQEDDSPHRFYHIVVSDNGIGFPQEYAQQIFEVFKRLHGRDTYSGTGIGLSLCKRIVEHYGGRIYAEGMPGEGARFHVLLPAG